MHTGLVLCITIVNFCLYDKLSVYPKIARIWGLLVRTVDEPCKGDERALLEYLQTGLLQPC